MALQDRKHPSIWMMSRAGRLRGIEVVAARQGAEDGSVAESDAEAGHPKADLVEGAYVDLLGKPDSTPGNGSTQ
jgi:hypothetical protein